MEIPEIPHTFVGVKKTHLKESRFIEFKHGFNPANEKNSKKYQQTICAFLNTKGGTIFFGIEDDGIITGIPNGHKSIDAVRLFCDNVIRCCLITNCGRLPYDVIQVFEIPFTDDKSVAAIKCIRPISETAFYQFTSDGTSYYRANASTLKYIRPTEPLFKNADISLAQISEYIKTIDVERRTYKSKMDELIAENLRLRTADTVVITVTPTTFTTNKIKTSNINFILFIFSIIMVCITMTYISAHRFIASTSASF